MVDFEDAIDKVMMGAERKSLLISEEEKRIIAYHEAGHALVAINIPGMDPVHKVTIIPRGRALGITQHLPDEKFIQTKEYYQDLIATMMGGRTAEQIVFEKITNGSSNDIERATAIARKMVCEWGMSEVMGPLTFGKKREEIFLGRELSTHRDYSEQTAVTIDKEVRKLVSDASDRAAAILEANIESLHAIAEALLERECISGEEIREIISRTSAGENTASGENESDSVKKEDEDDVSTDEPGSSGSEETVEEVTEEKSIDDEVVSGNDEYSGNDDEKFDGSGRVEDSRV